MRDTVQSWAAEHVAPVADKTDKENAFPMHLWKEMGSMGFLGVTAPGTCRLANLISPLRFFEAIQKVHLCFFINCDRLKCIFNVYVRI
jgi:alkylation response protein AidB-like acyl-CoA dehydrogenase